MRAEAEVNLVALAASPASPGHVEAASKNGRKGVWTPVWEVRGLRLGARHGAFWAREELSEREFDRTNVSQLRREARLRREYLYRKAREEAQRTAQEKKEKVRRALEGTFGPRH